MFLANIAHCIFIPRYYPFSVHFIDISSAQFTAQFWDKRVASNLIVTVCCANSLAPYSVLNVSSSQLAYHYLFRNINKSIHSYRYYLSVIKIIVQAWLFIFFFFSFLCAPRNFSWPPPPRMNLFSSLFAHYLFSFFFLSHLRIFFSQSDFCNPHMQVQVFFRPSVTLFLSLSPRIWLSSSPNPSVPSSSIP